MNIELNCSQKHFFWIRPIIQCNAMQYNTTLYNAIHCLDTYRKRAKNQARNNTYLYNKLWLKVQLSVTCKGRGQMTALPAYLWIQWNCFLCVCGPDNNSSDFCHVNNTFNFEAYHIVQDGALKITNGYNYYRSRTVQLYVIERVRFKINLGS